MKEGDRFDKFRIVRVLGEGGMATVYLARHAVLDSIHALKILRIDHESVRRRLIEEGRAQATLRHPNVVAVTDIVDTPQGVGLVMEYVNGPTLAEYQRGRALSVEESTALFKDMLLGIGAAHRAYLVHRDLKPENILLQHTEHGLVAKVTDFGLVKVLEGSGTKSGAMMGTPEYMAPEQARNAAAVDARADLWSLGAIFYEMLTGKVAFHREDLVETYAAIVSGGYAPLPDTLPERVRTTVQRLLRTDMSERFADVTSVFRHLFPDDPLPRMTALDASDRMGGVEARVSGQVPGSSHTLVPHVSGRSLEAAPVAPGTVINDEPPSPPTLGASRPAAPTGRFVQERRRRFGLLAVVGLVALAALVGVSLALLLRSGGGPVPRPVVLEITGAPTDDVALWVDGRRWDARDAVPPRVPGEVVSVRWAIGDQCGACPAPCPVWCGQGQVELTVSEGEGAQVVQLPVTPPPRRPVTLNAPGLSAARFVDGPELTVSADGARGSVAPGSWALVVQRGACGDALPDCSSTDACPEGCASALQVVEVPVGEADWVMPVRVPDLPAPSPSPAPVSPAPRPAPAPRAASSWVTKAAFAAFVAAQPEWGRDAAIGSGRADAGYLRDGLEGAGPVTRVTWSAANAYCASRGGLLGVNDAPTEWTDRSVTQEWRQSGGQVAWRRFDGVSSTRARPDQAFPFTGFRCRR